MYLPAHAHLPACPPAEALEAMLEELLPHRLTEYLYDLSSECAAAAVLWRAILLLCACVFGEALLWRSCSLALPLVAALAVPHSSPKYPRCIAPTTRSQLPSTSFTASARWWAAGPPRSRAYCCARPRRSSCGPASSCWASECSTASEWRCESWWSESWWSAGSARDGAAPSSSSA